MLEILSLQPEHFTGIFEVAMRSSEFAYEAIYDSNYLTDFISRHYGPQRLSKLMEHVHGDTMMFDVAVQDSQVIGFACAGDSPAGMELHRLYVRPEAIGKGIGKALLLRVEEFVRRKGFSTYFCFVHAANEVGKQFYLRAGFRHLKWLDTSEDWRMQKRIASRWVDLRRQLHELRALI